MSYAAAFETAALVPCSVFLAAIRRSRRRKAGQQSTPMRIVGTPPAISDQRAPACWPIQPPSGPPMGVVPSQASAQSAMVRPRIIGAEAACNMVLAIELKVMLP